MSLGRLTWCDSSALIKLMPVLGSLCGRYREGSALVILSEDSSVCLESKEELLQEQKHRLADKRRSNLEVMVQVGWGEHGAAAMTEMTYSPLNDKSAVLKNTESHLEKIPM